MARMCPRCAEIHFETTASPLPPACRKCGADLNEASGLMPQQHYDEPAPPADGDTARTPKPKRGRWPDGVRGMVTGGAILLAAGVLIALGTSWNVRAKEVAAEVLNAPPDTPKDFRRDVLTARYSVGAKSYYAYPGLRREKESFTLYYLPEDPATTYEMRPFLTLLFGGKLLLIGLAVLGFGVVKFLIGRARAIDLRRTMAAAEV